MELRKHEAARLRRTLLAQNTALHRFHLWIQSAARDSQQLQLEKALRAGGSVSYA